MVVDNQYRELTELCKISKVGSRYEKQKGAVAGACDQNGSN